MKIGSYAVNMKIHYFVVLVLFAFGGLTSYSQGCEHERDVEVRILDENEKPVKNATIEFENIPTGHPLEGQKFAEHTESYGSRYEATYCESAMERKDESERYTRQYDVSVKVDGYRDGKAKISIFHCLGSCLVNRGFITVVSNSARLVTIKGKVTMSVARYDEKGGIVRSEKLISGAPITFRRSTMVQFSATSDAEGNYTITVPAGTYGVYATAAPGCYMCAEYFGKIVGDEDSTDLNIALVFSGEG